MKIKINGKEEDAAVFTSLADLMASKHLEQKAVVVEHNYNIIPKEKWHETAIAEGDNIEIVSFVGGG